MRNVAASGGLQVSNPWSGGKYGAKVRGTGIRPVLVPLSLLDAQIGGLSWQLCSRARPGPGAVAGLCGCYIIKSYLLLAAVVWIWKTKVQVLVFRETLFRLGRIIYFKIQPIKSGTVIHLLEIIILIIAISIGSFII